MTHKLLAGRWMLAFREPRELLLLHFAGQAPSLRKLALPLTAHTFAFGERRLLALAVVAERERFTPCGACLDWIFQFADPETCMVFCQAARNGPVTEYLLQDLMPFHPK